MATVILLRSVPIEHVELAGESTSSRFSVVQRLPETIRPEVRAQTCVVRLPDSCILYWRLLRATEVLP
jgi:hypothetical protein